MAYHLEGKDIVINGFEKGIADTPYNGVSDMRNMEIVSIPGEASVEPILTAAAQAPVLSGVAYTASAATERLTIASTTGLFSGAAIVLASNTAGNLSDSIVYYVQNIVGNTFQVSLTPSVATPINISSDGTGTLTTYQYSGLGSPYSYYVDRKGSFAGANGTVVVDGNNHAWVILTSAQSAIPANTLIFLGNIGVTSFIATSGVTIWNGYLLLFTFQGIDYARINFLWATTGPAATWTYQWQVTSNQATNSRIGVLNAQEDGNLYWTSTTGLGSIIETPNDTFDPTDATSYTITSEALLLPEDDESTCLAELGGSILIGGRNAFVYIWNKVDPGFSGLLNIPENFTTAIVATSQNAYVFAGIRGRIYITNGSGIDLYKKFPDYLTGFLNPIIRWQDANFGRNQLYFGLTAADMGGSAINTLAGIWAIDLDNDALRLINKTTNTAYQGTVRMVAERPPASSDSPTTGILGGALQVGWYESSTVGIDLSTTANGYTGYESYLQTEMIPVGTFIDPFTPSQLEWKTSAPLATGEGVRISYRQNISAAFTVIGESTTAGAISDMYQANFQKVQWAQFKLETKTTATNPSYTRVTELRLRDWPSGKDNK